MIVFTLCPTPTSSVLHSSSNICLTHFALSSISNPIGGGSLSFKPRTRACRFLVLFSAHSNPKIVKSNRRSRYGQALSPYDSEEEDEEEGGDDNEDEDEFEDWSTDDEFAEVSDIDAKRKRSKLQGRFGGSGRKQPEKGQSRVLSIFSVDKELGGKNGKHTLEKSIDGSYSRTLNRKEAVSSLDARKEKLNLRKIIKNKYPRLFEEIDLDEKWLPLIDYLSTYGLKESHFIQMYERHMPSLQINICSAQERLEYLISVGVKQRDVKRILMRQPQILQYTVENNLKSHVAFLTSLGIPNSRIGQIIAAAPSLFSYSVENSLKPTVRYLVEEVGIKEKDLGKVVQLSPQILVQRIDISWNTRYIFLSKEIGASRDSMVKMVTKHPQLLHYSIDGGLLPRINFLRSIGMKNADILKVITSLTQVLSLSLEENLKPKYLYLINELSNEVHSLTKYPMYLSLSLDQRIRPRHKFLVSLKKAPKGPFPLSSLVPTDENFCERWAGTSLDKYLAFRQRLLLKEFANKYEKKH
ncbi:transcription termination factor MTERF9, chloroplastic [Humulus lupulus]|uniref:transcription termination factor MTERF9, chloroplastic n=1 Tax=Humulus lupulus TaxID=3486 RepID=UPI002B40EF9F|nr:transcription termination factor MTERF9, chloroplastic [Humulus lupulus]